MAAPSCYITIVKRFTYRGDANEEWSNSYALTGSTPSDSTAWRALFDALVAEEKKVYRSASKVVAGYGYAGIPDPGDAAVWSVDMDVAPNSPVPGTLSGSGAKLAGDQAAWVRWGLDRLNSRGKRIYLRKYFHDGFMDALGGDAIDTTWQTTLNAFGAKLQDGSFLDARKITDKDGTALVGHGSSSYVTTRTLKRRGKRPGS